MRSLRYRSGPYAEARGAPAHAEVRRAGRGWSRALRETLGIATRMSFRESLRKRWRAACDMVHRPLLTVTFEDAFVRVVLIRSDRVLAWGTSVVDDGPFGQDRDGGAGDQWVAAQLRALVNGLPSPRGRLVSALPVNLPLVRRLKLPKIGSRYLRQVVFSEVLETVPFSEDEVDIGWSRRGAGEDGEVLATAVPRAAIDSHVLLLTEAGLRPRAIYSRSAALAMAVGVPDVLIVDVRPGSSVVIAVHDGVPTTVYEVLARQGEAGADDRAEALARAIQYVDGYSRSVAEGETATGAPPLPVVLTGCQARDERLVESLEVRLGRGVASPLITHFAFPPHFPVQEYAANLGLALAYRRRTAGRRLLGGARAPLDLLPERHRGPSLPVLPAAAGASLLVLCGLAFLANSELRAIEARRDVLAGHLVALERQKRGHDLSFGSARAVDRRADSAALVTSAMEEELAQLDDGISATVTRLALTSEQAVHSGVRLSTLSSQPYGYLLTGTAASYEDVILYADELTGSGLFTGARLVWADSTKDGDTPAGASAVTFRIEARVGPPLDGALAEDPVKSTPRPLSAR